MKGHRRRHRRRMILQSKEVLQTLVAKELKARVRDLLRKVV